MSETKIPNYRKGLFDQYLVEVSGNMPANRLQKAIFEVARTWDNVLLTGKPEDFFQEIEKLLIRLNAAFPRCSPARPHFSTYSDINASVYIKVGMNEAFTTVTFTAVRNVRTTLLEGGVAK